jgi:hypothetical protein
MIGKKHIEQMCRAAGMVPVARVKIDGTEVFIADGFSAIPSISFQKFGIEPEDFPGGCFGTMWWAACREDKLDFGRPMFFDRLHNVELSTKSKQLARIRAAADDAKVNLDRRKRAHLNG